MRDNVGFGLELRGDSAADRRRVVDEKLELVGLRNGRIATSSELSGGMQQRVGLARAFATEADILLMDEPFSALDPLIRGKLQDELLALQAQVKQDHPVRQPRPGRGAAPRRPISILQNGRIVQTGTAGTSCCAPADDYVAEFVRHMNPLDVLTGEMIMCSRACEAALWLDAAYRADAAVASACSTARPQRSCRGRGVGGPDRGGAPACRCRNSSICARRAAIRCCCSTAAGSSGCAARRRSSGRWPGSRH